MKKIIGNPIGNNLKNIEIIKKNIIDNKYLDKKLEFGNEILANIKPEMSVLDIGKSMREKFDTFDCKEKNTMDINIFEDYPNYQFDISEKFDLSKTELYKKFDIVICLAVLEHVYDPFTAIKNIKMMMKNKGTLYGYVPYLYHYHAPADLIFQDYYRYSKDGLSYLLKDFNEVKLYPIRGRLSSSMLSLFGSIWKKSIERTGINIFLDKFFSNFKNHRQCSGFNFIAKL